MKHIFIITFFMLGLSKNTYAQWTTTRSNPYNNTYGYGWAGTLSNYPFIGFAAGYACSFNGWSGHVPPKPVCFDYDDAGNRIIRYAFLLPIWKQAAIKDEHIGSIAEKLTSDQELDANSIQVFPNPTTDFITVNQKNTAQDAKIELYSPNGQLLITKAAGESTTLDTKDLTPGFYLLVLRAGGATAQWKVTKI